MTQTPPRAIRTGLLIAGLAVVGVLGGCYEEPVAITTYPPTSQPGPTQESLITGRAPSAGCVEGWSSPEAGSAELEEGLEALDRQLEPAAGLWQVDDVRQFTGPDVASSAAPAENVTRWYLRVSLATDSNFHGRFLIERRSDLDARVVAVAPYDTTGYQSPDWTGFHGGGEPHTYLGLPGRWSGTPYDFVSGGGYSGQPGLPDQVIGCLSDT